MIHSSLKKRVKPLLCLFILLFATQTVVVFAQSDQPEENQNLDSLLADARDLKDSWKEDQALEAYLDVLEVAPDNYEALWNASLMYSREGRRLDNEDKKENYFKKGKKLAEQAMKENPDGADGYYVMSVAMARMALISGPSDRVAASRDIKKYAELALEKDSLHDGSYHLLGRWHHKVANLSFVEELAANTLFGGIPDASDQEAVQYMKKAVEIYPEFILYHRDMAKIYRSLDKDKLALEHARKALDLPKKQQDDDEYKEEMRELVSDLE